MLEIAPRFFNPDNIKEVSIKRDLMKIEQRMVQAAKSKKAEEKKSKKKKKRFVFS